MAAQIISFAARLREPATRDWSSQELAEFYRVESALLQAGLHLESDRGLSDEGDPWFVFCRVDSGEVFIHFARVDGWYVVDGAAMGSPARGRDFGALVRDLISRHPLADVRRPGSNILIHPAAILIALVGAAFFHSSRAKAAEPDAHVHDAAAGSAKAEGRRGLVLNVGASTIADGGRAVGLDAAEVAAVLTGVAIGLRELAAATPAAAEAPGTSAPQLAPLSAPAPHEASVRVERSSNADVLAALTAVDARAALTVMAVFHDLARTAAAAAPQAAAALVTAPAAAEVVDGFQGVASSAAPAGLAPLLVVHLSSGPLPQIEALALVAADGALARVSPDRVVHVDQLPSLLSYLIGHGEIVSAASTGVDASGSGTVADHAAGADSGAAATASDHGVATPAPAPVDTGHVTTDTKSGTSAPGHESLAVASPPVSSAPPTAPPNAGVAETASASPPVVHPVVAPLHSPLIDAAVQAFVSEVTDVQVMISGHDVVFYDPRILSMLGPGEVLDSISWRLEDGSSVSLVGTAAEIHAFHGLG